VKFFPKIIFLGGENKKDTKENEESFQILWEIIQN
jgi:hypothetical protein